MKSLLLLLVCGFVVTGCRERKTDSTVEILPDSARKEVPQIPETMTEAVRAVSMSLSRQDSKKFLIMLKGGGDPFSGESFFNTKSFGMQLRNSWGLWTESQLKDYFSQRGVTHPDWMTSAIFEAWSDEVENGSFDEEAIIAKYAKVEKDWREWSESSDSFTEAEGSAPDPFAE